eukprot:jgi/Tetstr1/465614/TSEL_010260.t1
MKKMDKRMAMVALTIDFGRPVRPTLPSAGTSGVRTETAEAFNHRLDNAFLDLVAEAEEHDDVEAPSHNQVVTQFLAGLRPEDEPIIGILQVNEREHDLDNHNIDEIISLVGLSDCFDMSDDVGLQERMWLTLSEMTVAMLLHAVLGREFWALAFCAAMHIRNNVYSRGVGSVSYRRHTGKTPDVSGLRMFGCPAYVHVDAGNKRKLDVKAFRV